MNVRLVPSIAVLLLGGCHAAEPRAPHPAATAGAAMTEEQELSFFAEFDEDSFRILAEHAFTAKNPETREKAAWLLNAVVWNWHPELPQKDARRRRAHLLLFQLTRHPDPRVRAGAWRVARYTFEDPAIAAPASDAFAGALADPDPDVRHAALQTAQVLHLGYTGGCVVDRKKTSFTLRVHADRLSMRLFVEPDPRVRAELLRALAWCGREGRLPVFTRYFTEADRRDEVPVVGRTIHGLFVGPAAGIGSAQELGTFNQRDASWDRFRAFTETLTGSDAARRNGLVLLLFMASDMSTSMNEDRALLRRVVEWLERDEENLREEDLLLIVDHWPVMKPADVVHRLNDTIRRSSLPEIVKGLREILASDP